METVLEVKELSVSFTQYIKGMRQRRLQVIRDLSLQIGRGEIVAVVGSSGSGKSLLAHAILGLLPYNSHMEGEILFLGKRLTQKEAKRLRGGQIVLVPQGISYLDPLMKVGPQLRKGDRSSKAAAAARKVLARYGLDKNTEELYPFELSGGMARRVLISTAVMETPQLVIADEPTPGLDDRAAARILKHFREIADEGAGVLLITHDLEAALTVADKIVVFYAGETIETAGCSDFAVQGRLRHPYTKALWQAMPSHGFMPISGAQPYPEEVSGGCLFAARCDRCRKECIETEKIASLDFEGGQVRCLYPKTGDEVRKFLSNY